MVEDMPDGGSYENTRLLLQFLSRWTHEKEEIVTSHNILVMTESVGNVQDYWVPRFVHRSLVLGSEGSTVDRVQTRYPTLSHSNSEAERGCHME